MSPAVGACERGDNGFPRVSGDEPNCYALDTPKIAFSPRERG